MMQSPLQWPRGGLPLLAVLFAFACRGPAPPPASDLPYLLTESPLPVGEGIELCIAVDPREQQGVWWWTPGQTGCSSRSSGPGLVHADQAAISRGTSPGDMTVSFRLGTHSIERPFMTVRLVVRDGNLQALESGAHVRLQSRANLDVPETPGGGR